MAKETYNPYGFIPATVGDDSIQWLPAAASQTWARGDMLTNVGGAGVAIASSTSASLTGCAADARTSTSAGDMVPVYIDPDGLYIGRADADASGLYPGDQIDLVGSTGAQMVDVGASSTDVFTFVRAEPFETASETGARVRVRITHGKADAQ